ncbi:hypothetical protein [Bradyrhizobium sp.]
MTKGKPKAEARKSPPAEKAAAALAAQFRAAALQRRLVEPWLRDRNFIESEGGTILYAVDSDIVKLFTDPFRTSIAQGARPGYAEIIPGQERTVSEALGWILANFIFTKLSGEWPVFILSPADDEISNIFNAVARKAGGEHTQALVSIKRLENWIQAHGTSTIDKAYFEDNLTEILAVIAGEKSFSAELVRFSRLLNSGKLITLDQHLLESRLPDETVRNALSAPNGIHQMIEFRQMSKIWEEKVDSFDWPTREPRNNEVDAAMLARLEWINKGLEGSKFRFVLITGSHLIDEVTRQHYSKQLPGTESFAARFVRSPKAYLGDPRVISPISESDIQTKPADYAVGRRLQDWLNTVLGVDEREYPDRTSYLGLIDRWAGSADTELRNEAARKLALNPRLADDIDEKWRAFVKEVSTMAAQTETQRRLETFDERLPARQQVAALRDELEQSLKISWDEAYKAALGSALTVSPKDEPQRPYPPRNFPLVHLDGHPKTNAAIEQYLSAWRASKLTPDVYQELREAPTGDRPHWPYLEFFVQAYVLGVTNRWRISEVTAALAISLARDYREQYQLDARKNRISGREAAFWRAYALRSSARGAQDLVRARAALQLARDLAQEDVADAHDFPREEDILDAKGDLDVKPIRFDAERLAIDLSEMCFELFLQNERPKLSPSTVAKAVNILASASEYLELICKESELDDLFLNEKKSINAFCFQRILTNYFMVALIIYHDHTLDAAQISERLAQFRLLVDHPKRDMTRLSYLVLIVYEAAIVVFSTDAGLRRKARNEFRTLYNNMASNQTMPYDANRFAFLNELVRTSR